jgi:hypothetical protein
LKQFSESGQPGWFSRAQTHTQQQNATRVDSEAERDNGGRDAHGHSSESGGWREFWWRFA